VVGQGDDEKDETRGGHLRKEKRLAVKSGKPSGRDRESSQPSKTRRRGKRKKDRQNPRSDFGGSGAEASHDGPKQREFRRSPKGARQVDSDTSEAGKDRESALGGGTALGKSDSESTG